jgi:integrase/recombinase XerD
MLLLAVRQGSGFPNSSNLTCGDVHLGTGAHLMCHGKGRKDGATPLTTGSRAVLREWLAERLDEPTAPLYGSRHGQPQRYRT